MQKGTLNFVLLENTTKEAVSNLTFEIYQIGIKNEQGNFEYSEGFEKSNLDIDTFTKENINIIQEYATKNASPIYTKTTDSEGKISIKDVDVGAYLFVQSSNKDEYMVQTTYAVLPEITLDGNYNYDVTLAPKVSKTELVSTITNTKVPLTNESSLPYTGTFSVLVPVLVIIAIIEFCIGWLKTFGNSKKSKVGIVCMVLAVIAILGAGILLVYNNKEESRIKEFNENIVTELEEKMDQTTKLNDEEEVEKDLSWLDESTSVGTKYSKTIENVPYIGILYFPQISNLAVPVIDDCTDENLKKSACRYSGNIDENNMVIAGHSYKSIFGKLSSKLEEGDIIYFKTLDGIVHKYKLTNIEKLLPTDVTQMQTGDWDFTIFTCSYDNQKRIAYRFDVE